MADTPSTETQTQQPAAMPENLDLREAAELMAGFDDDGKPVERPENNGQPDPDNAQPEGNEVVDTEEGEEQPEQEAAPEVDAPQFWEAEDKAAFAALPPELKAVVAKYDAKRVEHEQAKNREVAEKVKEAETRAAKANETVEQAAQWWQQNGPQFAQAFGDKWTSFLQQNGAKSWTELAQKDPALWAAAKAQHDDEAAMLIEADRRGQADMQAAADNAKAKFAEAKRAGHEVVAKEMPDLFGTREKADATYKALGEYLVGQGIPAERINAIHEPAIIKLAVKAWKHDEAQKKVSALVNRDEAGKFTAKTTPTRVQPGPAARVGAGDRNAEQARRVGERFRKTGGADIQDAAELIRLHGL